MNVPSYLPRPGTPNLTFDPGETAVQILAALSGPAHELPIEALQGLIDRNRRLLDEPDDELPRILARQAILLEGVEAAMLLKAAHATKPDHVATYTRTALHAHKCLIGALAALRTISQATKDAQALTADA